MYIVLDDVVENLFNDVINAYKIKSMGGGGCLGVSFHSKKTDFFIIILLFQS